MLPHNIRIKHTLLFFFWNKLFHKESNKTLCRKTILRMPLRKQAKILIAVLLALLPLIVVLLYTQIPPLATSPTLTPTSTPSSTPTPEPVDIAVKVTPWGSMYRTEPDCKEDFSVELVAPKPNENFTTNNFNVTFNAGAFYWVIEKAYCASDLFSGERWITISKNQYTQDLQKTFAFNLTNVPTGNHYLTLTVVFHEGTKNNATALFTVSSWTIFLCTEVVRLIAQAASKCWKRNNLHANALLPCVFRRHIRIQISDLYWNL